MNDPGKITIKKLEAAQRQLDCAIELWLQDGDEVSIHTLAAAAYQITHDIKVKKGIDHELLYDSAMVKDEYRKQWINTLKKAPNFFKHADKDPDPEGSIEFSPFGNLVFIMVAASGLALLGIKPSLQIRYFMIWLALHEPRLVKAPFIKKLIDSASIEDFEGVKTMSKTAFFAAYLNEAAQLERKRAGSANFRSTSVSGD